MSADKPTAREIAAAVWAASDAVRAGLDPVPAMHHVLAVFFFKCVADEVREGHEAPGVQPEDDGNRLGRAPRLERWYADAGSDFRDLYKHRDTDDLGLRINAALADLEAHNRETLKNVFDGLDFNAKAKPASTRKRLVGIRPLLEALHEIDCRPSRLATPGTLGDAFERLLNYFAAEAGKRGGELHTPPDVAELLARLLAPVLTATPDPDPGNADTAGCPPAESLTIADPVCGAGSLLMSVSRQAGSDTTRLFGEEADAAAWALCRMHLLLHGIDNARIEHGDALRSPRLVERGRLMRFDIVVGQLPFGRDEWRRDAAESDRFNRFWRGVPPKDRGDYAFISHMIETAVEARGRVGVIVPHGVLFRSGAEGRIRTQLIEDNLLDLVLGLPPSLLHHTPIPTAVLVFDKSRPRRPQPCTGDTPHATRASGGVLFIDASEDFEYGSPRNQLTEEQLSRIVRTYHNYQHVDRFARVVTAQELINNDCNLSIARYIDAHEHQSDVDPATLERDIATLETELARVRREMAQCLTALSDHTQR